jgi:hypothetical protein
VASPSSNYLKSVIVSSWPRSLSHFVSFLPMDVSTLARHLGIDEPRVIAKAKELVNLAKVRVSGGLGPGEVCKPAICLELACQMYVRGLCSHSEGG